MMKKTVLYIALLGLVPGGLLSGSCNSKEPNNNNSVDTPEAVVTVTPETVVIPGGSGEGTFTVTSTAPWTLSLGDADWISASPMEGAAGETVTVTLTVSPMQTPEARTAVLGIVLNNGTTAATLTVQTDAPDDGFLRVSLRSHAGVTIEQWDPTETAIVICDMWDKHWCSYATARVAEMAGAMNATLIAARERGVTIVHAPSECMNYYRDYPGRKRIMSYRNASIAALARGDALSSEQGAAWPVDQNDGGCDGPGVVNDPVWSKEIATLTIYDEDLISDSGEEIGTYFLEAGIKNAILMGVHTNMCIVNRTFGLRAMTRMGLNAVLVRDHTDLMYNPNQYPYVSHFDGLDLMIEYIETYICPTILSTDLTQKAPFVFAERK
jgi:hypothetical protein